MTVTAGRRSNGVGVGSSYVHTLEYALLVVPTTVINHFCQAHSRMSLPPGWCPSLAYAHSNSLALLSILFSTRSGEGEGGEGLVSGEGGCRRGRTPACPF
jgi:hypothetical protein